MTFVGRSNEESDSDYKSRIADMRFALDLLQ